METYEKISTALQRGKAKDVKALVQEAVDNGISAENVLNQALLTGMSIIGTKFKNNEIYVPEVLMSARAMKAGTEILKPLLVSAGVESIGRAVIGTVKGDLHDIGKNLVAMMLEGKGFEVIDLGTDVSAECFIETAREKNADFLCCSALLTTTMNEMKRVVDLAVKENVRDRFTIMVGGAPVNEDFAKRIGADIYTPDAASAADAAADVLAEKKRDLQFC